VIQFARQTLRRIEHGFETLTICRVKRHCTAELICYSVVVVVLVWKDSLIVFRGGACKFHFIFAT